MSQQSTIGGHAGLLPAWHLAILRFALTRENADRLGVLMIANEIDRLGRPDGAGPDFSFFRRTSAELYAAIPRHQDGDDAVLHRYLAEIDDARLHRALAAALDVSPPKPDLVRKSLRPNRYLWRGLP